MSRLVDFTRSAVAPVEKNQVGMARRSRPIFAAKPPLSPNGALRLKLGSARRADPTLGRQCSGSLRRIMVNFCVQALVAVDFQDFAVGIDFDLALAAFGGAVEVINHAAIVGIGVIRGHSEAGDLGLGGGEEIGWDGAGLRGAGCASAAGCAGGAGSTLIRGAACSAILRGSAGGEQGGGGDEEKGFQCFHSLVGFIRVELVARTDFLTELTK